MLLFELKEGHSMTIATPLHCVCHFSFVFFGLEGWLRDHVGTYKELLLLICITSQNYSLVIFLKSTGVANMQIKDCFEF